MMLNPAENGVLCLSGLWGATYGVQPMGCNLWGATYGDWTPGCNLWGATYGVQPMGCNLWGLARGVQAMGCNLWGAAYRVVRFPPTARAIGRSRWEDAPALRG